MTPRNPTDDELLHWFELESRGVEAGIPCAQFGPNGSGEHTADEWVDIASVKLVARVLETAARRSCA